MTTATTEHTMTIGLFEPGMTAIHRAGLAGLWMTLEAIEDDDSLRERLEALGGRWQRTPTSVEFTYEDDGTQFFRELIRASFRLTDDGRFWFLGLGHPDGFEDRGVVLQAALLNTFLQHGKTRNADKSQSPGGRITLDVGDQQRVFTYRRILAPDYAQNRASGSYSPQRRVALTGWHFPGGVVRHTASGFKATELSDPAGMGLALLFAPLGVIYFEIKQRSAGARAQFALAAPEVGGLAAYARARRHFLRTPVRELIVAGAADAAMKLISALSAEGILTTATSLRSLVVAFGVLPWSTQQKSRMDVLEIQSIATPAILMYRAADALLPPLVRSFPARTNGREADEADGFRWEVSPIREHAARNIRSGVAWWRGFAEMMVDREARQQVESYEQLVRASGADGGVTAVVAQDDAFGDNAAEALVRACHEAWRVRMGQLKEQAQRQGSNQWDLIDRERERLRIAFAHAKNADTLRWALTDFWARAGRSLPALQEAWPQVLPFLTSERWREARDLALLALASYRGEPRNVQAGRGAGAAPAEAGPNETGETTT